MRILGRTDDNCLNPYDFCFLGMAPLPFDNPWGTEAWPRATSISTVARLDAEFTTGPWANVRSVSTVARLGGTVEIV